MWYFCVCVFFGLVVQIVVQVVYIRQCLFVIVDYIVVDGREYIYLIIQLFVFKVQVEAYGKIGDWVIQVGMVIGIDYVVFIDIYKVKVIWLCFCI